jgi:dipeptidyl aminopeptidase/acylaminoacyl peptidase
MTHNRTFDFERYLNIRSAYAPAWLEAGQKIAFLSNITGTPQVWSVAAAGGWPDQLSFFQDKVWALSASPAGDRLVCTRDVGGNERYQLFLISADGTEIRRLTQDDQAIHIFGAWSHDGQRIAYASNGRNGRHFDVYIMGLDGSQPQLIWQSDGSFHVIDWSPDDRRLLLSHEISSAEQPLFVLELDSRQIRPLAPTTAPVSYQHPHWAADGSIYLLTNRDRDLMSLARLDPDTGEVFYMIEESWEVEALALSPGGRLLAYTLNDEGYARLYLYDPAGQDAPQLVSGLPPGIAAEPVFSADGRQVAISVQSPQRNLDIWRVTVSSLACHQVTRSSLAGIPQDSLVAPELIHYPTFDQRQIPAFFYRPAHVKPPWPVILYVHGGPASQIRPDFDPRFQFFLHRGYAILAPNVRGSSGYGAAYMALDDVRLRMDSVTDLNHAVAWLRTSGEIDPKRIAIYGRSYGGFMVLAAITTYPDLWAAAIDVVGIGNWATFLENTGPWRRAHREKEYGSLEEDREFLESISPIHQLHRIQAPLLVIHGANDPRVPVGEAEQMVSRLRQRQHPVEYLCYADEGHMISKLKNRIDSFSRMADFLDRTL